MRMNALLPLWNILLRLSMLSYPPVTRKLVSILKPRVLEKFGSQNLVFRLCEFLLIGKM